MFKRLPDSTIYNLQAGDETAFNEVYHHYRDLLYVIVFSITKHPQTSEDLLQDTFIKVFTEAKSLRNPSAFHGWIIRIARNGAINRLKQPPETTLDPEAWDQIGKSDVPTNFISLWQSCLSEKENLVIAYRLVYELTFKEIAALLQEPLTSVHRDYREALKTLKAWYNQSGGQ
jgi:RNA polymerase sigma-70 factor (ECF subfamily)